MSGNALSMIVGSSNPTVAAARAKSRKARLLDRTRLRQLIQQTPDQLTASIADSGYRAEIDLYASRHSGSDLVEMALTHNLESELSAMLKVCSGDLRSQVAIYADRYTYQNAKVVLRAIRTDADEADVRNAVLPEENDLNRSWLEWMSTSDSLRSAVERMSHLPFGKALLAVSEEADLNEYEDALDKHYFASALEAARGTDASTRILRSHLQMEIDHRNILNILEAQIVVMDKDDLAAALLPGGRLITTSQLNAAASADRNGLLDLLRRSSRFDIAGFEAAIEESDTLRTLDPIVVWLHRREQEDLQRMSYLHPVSSLPVIHYISTKIREVADLRMIIRGVGAGLPTEVLEAHIL